jgi:hypothetical protein
MFETPDTSTSDNYPPTPATPIDRLTLELLTNRRQYRQYLKQTDTQKYLEQTDFLQKIQRYEPVLLDVIHQLLDNPDKPITNEINDTFIPFIRAILKHIESVEMNGGGDGEGDPHAEDEDILFGNCVDIPANHRRRNSQNIPVRLGGGGGGSDGASGPGSYSDNLVQYSMQMFMKPSKRGLLEKQKQTRFMNKNNGNENNISNDYKYYYDSDQEEI